MEQITTFVDANGNIFVLQYNQEEKLTTIFSFDGLKRKDNGQRDYIGQIACYCDKNKQPFVLKKAQGGRVEIDSFSKYNDTYLPDYRTKLYKSVSKF